MNGLQIFENVEFGQMRTVTIDGEPWFVGKDVAVALGYSEPRSAVSKKVEQEDKGVAKMETPSGIQEMTIINESGLYALIFGSKLESAKRFKHWVTSEVLPSIRKTGNYGEISEKWQKFMEEQAEFNRMVIDCLINGVDNKASRCNTNKTPFNHEYSLDEMVSIEKRKKELYGLTAKVAELCEVPHTALLHQAYQAIERKRGIVLNCYRSVYQSETGKQDAGIMEVIAAHDWIYESMLDLCNYVIRKKSIFD